METNNNNTGGNNGDGKGGETPPNQNPQNPTTGNDTPSGNEQNGGAGEKKVLMGDINTKKIVEEKRKINILSSEDVQKRMSARTEQEIKNPPLGGGEQSGSSAPLPTSLEEYRNKINEDSRKAVNEMTPDKYKSLAMSLVKVFDFLLSAGLRKYALDVTDSGYSIEQTKKDELAEQLANILIVTNTMFPAAGVFIITLIAVYLTPVMNAYSHRQQVIAIRDQKKKEGKPEIDIDPKTGLPKKKRGGQPKG